MGQARRRSSISIRIARSNSMIPANSCHAHTNGTETSGIRPRLHLRDGRRSEWSGRDAPMGRPPKTESLPNADAPPGWRSTGASLPLLSMWSP